MITVYKQKIPRQRLKFLLSIFLCIQLSEIAIGLFSTAAIAKEVDISNSIKLQAQTTQEKPQRDPNTSNIPIVAPEVKLLVRELLIKTSSTSFPFIVSSTDPNQSRTAAVLPVTAWNRAATLAGVNKNFDWQETHQIISAMMLTDALTRSGF